MLHFPLLSSGRVRRLAGICRVGTGFATSSDPFRSTSNIMSYVIWPAIDPKGVVGDPGYEVGASFYNPMARILEVPIREQLPARQVAQLSEELGMQRARIRGWGLAQCVPNACNQLSMNPQGILRCAEILSRLPVHALSLRSCFSASDPALVQPVHTVNCVRKRSRRKEKETIELRIVIFLLALWQHCQECWSGRGVS
jgi:hypothetical protein